MIRYYQNCVSVGSTHMASIRKAARDAGIMVVIGIAERDGGSLYMAQTFIGPQGDVLLHRRKFKPTGLERIFFGDAVSIPVSDSAAVLCLVDSRADLSSLGIVPKTLCKLPSAALVGFSVLNICSLFSSTTLTSNANKFT